MNALRPQHVLKLCSYTMFFYKIVLEVNALGPQYVLKMCFYSIFFCFFGGERQHVVFLVSVEHVFYNIMEG